MPSGRLRDSTRRLRRSHWLVVFALGSLLVALTPMLGVAEPAAAGHAPGDRGDVPFDQKTAMSSPHHPAVPANAKEPAAPVLDREGWTVTASSAETARENGRAANVLDGDARTIWHTEWSGTATPPPHTLTVDMHRTAVVSGLVYRPRADNPNGRVGEYGISVSKDGQDWADPVGTGTLADDNSAKTLSFAPQGARYVRLTVLSEAGKRGPWAAAAEIDLLGDPGTPSATVDLSRSGWTATASSEETAGEDGRAANVLDGDAGTFWHSRWSGGTPAPLPHSITIDMHRTAGVSALSYEPRQGKANGRAGAYTVTTSADGTTFGEPVAKGTWRDDDTVKTATFTRAVQARYVRLTVTSEAGGRGPWTAAGEIRLSGPADPSAHGSWGRLIGFPLVPVATAVLPGDKMLAWSAYAVDRFGGSNGYTQTAILDLKTNKVTQRRIDNTGHDMFCPGIAMLADGRVLVTGGSNADKASIYDPATDEWSRTSEMNIARGYQAMTLLSTGDAFVLGGSWSGGRGGKDGEVWSPDTGTWRKLPGVPVGPTMTDDPDSPYRADNHMWLHAMSGGKVLQLGPGKKMHWITTTGDGSLTDAGPRADSGDAMNGNAVPYDTGKLLTLGGGPAYERKPATRRAYTVNAFGDRVEAARTGDMDHARSFSNSVVMPDGKVAVFGGQSMPVPFSDATSAMTPELWDPATGKFTPLATMAVPRNYHSVANLLPDGRVFSGGGGLCADQGCATNHPDGSVFTPPYLLNADGSLKPRPSITGGVPPRAALGTSLTVKTDKAVKSFVLMRAAAATHSTDNDQRRVPLTSAQTAAGTYEVSVPDDPGVALPGTYMLFALDAEGVPSTAKFVTVS